MDTLTPKFSVELLVADKRHHYRIWQRNEYDERVLTDVFPGVTGYLNVINKPALLPWAKKEALSLVRAALESSLSQANKIVIDKAWIDQVIAAGMKRPDKIKDEAANLGTLVHKYIDQIIRGKIPTELTPEMEPAVTAFLNWWEKSKIGIVMGDTKVASLVHRYGGSLDALGRQNGNYVILDWKTSNGIYAEYALQVAAYAHAFSETYGSTCSRGFIVRFSKKYPITFEVKEIADLGESFQAFLAAKNLTNRMMRDHYL
jgi:hypothetical protein